jgi:hypothetical protein
MFQYIHELPEIEDILNTLVFEDEPSIFDEDNTIELMETALHLMEEYVIDNPTAISEPDFHEDLLEEIKDIFYIQFEEEILRSDFIEDDLNELLEEAFNIFITTFYPERSNNQESNIVILETETIKNVIDQDFKENKIIGLREIPQPVQRTPEWYQFRWNLITAVMRGKHSKANPQSTSLFMKNANQLKSSMITVMKT